MTVIQSYNSKNTPSGKVCAVKIAEAALSYVFRMVFPTSLFWNINSYQLARAGDVMSQSYAAYEH